MVKGNKKIEKVKVGKIIGNKVVTGNAKLAVYGGKSIGTRVNTLLRGNKALQGVLRGKVGGKKSMVVKESANIVGRKDITPILVALDLV